MPTALNSSVLSCLAACVCAVGSLTAADITAIEDVNPAAVVDNVINETVIVKVTVKFQLQCISELKFGSLGKIPNYMRTKSQSQCLCVCLSVTCMQTSQECRQVT